MELAGVGRRLGVLVFGALGLWITAACGAKSQSAGDAPGVAGSQSVAGSQNVAGTSSGGGATAGGASSSGAGSSGGTGAGGASSAGASSAGAPSEAGNSSGGGATGGAAPVGVECEKDADCVIADDCCRCHAEPRGASYPVCDLACETSACQMWAVPPAAVCTLGRCTLDASCDVTESPCDSPPPNCPSGQAPVVLQQGCWGPCVASTECARVTSCDACGPGQLCVSLSTLGPPRYRCIDQDPACQPGRLCECLAPCDGFGCSEQGNELSCFCAGC